MFKGYNHVSHQVRQKKTEAQKKKVPRLAYYNKAQADVAATGLSKKPSVEALEYLNSPVIAACDDEEIDILQWWRSQEYMMPAMASMAREFLAIQATSAPSERAFSLARHVITEFRGGLAPETIRALMCLKTWLKDEEEGKIGEELDYDSDGEEVEEVERVEVENGDERDKEGEEENDEDMDEEDDDDEDMLEEDD